MIKWKKFKVQKLPAQKSPSRFAGMEASKVAEKSARAKFGEAPEYMGMSQKSMTDLAAESYAMKAENKMFFKTLQKELKTSRAKTASGVKGLRAAGKKVPKASIFKAKQKGAMKSLKTAETKSQQAFTEITKRIKCSPEECLMVGNDYKKDIVPAKSAGMKTVLISSKVLNGEFPEADKVDTSIKDLSELLIL